MTEDEIVGWHGFGWTLGVCDGQEFEQALGFDDGPGSLGCCSPWDLKESDIT